MRVTRGFKARRRRNRVLKLSKGYRGRRKNCYKRANQAVQRRWTGRFSPSWR